MDSGIKGGGSATLEDCFLAGGLTVLHFGAWRMDVRSAHMEVYFRTGGLLWTGPKKNGSRS